MKKLLTLILPLFCTISASAQISSADFRLAQDIQSDTQMEKYVWTIGSGVEKEDAVKDAIRRLEQMATTQTTIFETNVSNVSDGKSAESSVSTQATSVGISNLNFSAVKHIYLEKRGNMEVALCYMTAEEWQHRDDGLKHEIEECIASGDMYVATESIDDALRMYSWAHILLAGYPKNDIKIDGLDAKLVLDGKIKKMLNDIDVNVIAIEEDKDNKNYPYKVMLDFLYNDEPIPYANFSYFDGSGTVTDEEVKDGRTMVQMKKLPETFTVTIDYVHEDHARLHNKTIIVLLPRVTTFKECVKEVSTKGFRPKDKVDTNSSKVVSKVTERLKAQEADYAAVSEVVVDVQAPYRNIMTDIVESFSNIAAKDIRSHFTDSAWSEYQKIVAEGNPTLARTPSWSFIEHDSLVICREMPVKLHFKGNKKFVEDVIFRVNKNTKKIESLAYKLSVNTEKNIMAKEWPERDRLTLITFLEDYRTAYCLRDINYINKVFSDDAYIIVGKVLQQSKKKYNDNPNLINQGGNVVYTQQSKREYVANLAKSFQSKEFVNVRFEECNVGKGYNAKEGIYAVQVRQLYYSNNYADDGILTLAIDMRKKEAEEKVNPLVRVRVWQQERDVTYDAEQMIERTVSTEGSISAN